MRAKDSCVDPLKMMQDGRVTCFWACDLLDPRGILWEGHKTFLFIFVAWRDKIAWLLANSLRERIMGTRPMSWCWWQDLTRACWLLVILFSWCDDCKRSVADPYGMIERGHVACLRSYRRDNQGKRLVCWSSWHNVTRARDLFAIFLAFFIWKQSWSYFLHNATKARD